MLCNDRIEGISPLNSGEITIRGVQVFDVLKNFREAGRILYFQFVM
jgi:hypothetical protein